MYDICVTTYSAGDWVPAKGGIIAVEPIRDLPGADHCPHGVTVPQRLAHCYYIRYNLRKKEKVIFEQFCNSPSCGSGSGFYLNIFVVIQKNKLSTSYRYLVNHQI
jgi:hypothetical protein